MEDPIFKLVLTVNSTSGGPWIHVYDLPRDQRQRNEIVGEIANKIPILNEPTGIIFLRNPSAVYNVSNIVRFGWALSGPPQQQVTDEVERQLGLNIPR